MVKASTYTGSVSHFDVGQSRLRSYNNIVRSTHSYDNYYLLSTIRIDPCSKSPHKRTRFRPFPRVTRADCNNCCYYFRELLIIDRHQTVVVLTIRLANFDDAPKNTPPFDTTESRETKEDIIYKYDTLKDTSKLYGIFVRSSLNYSVSIFKKFFFFIGGFLYD